MHESAESTEQLTVDDTRLLRPTFITILAVLHIVGGTVGLCMMADLVLNPPKVADPLPNESVLVFLVFGFYIALLALLAGVGMANGWRWGWWLTAYYYLYRISGSANALFFLGQFHEEVSAGSRGVGHYLAQYGFRLLIGMLIIWYLFSDRVLEYFRLADQSRLRSAFSVIAGAIATVVLQNVLALFT